MTTPEKSLGQIAQEVFEQTAGKTASRSDIFAASAAAVEAAVLQRQAAEWEVYDVEAAIKRVMLQSNLNDDDDHDTSPRIRALRAELLKAAQSAPP
jgi:hypothetical protein